jgi:hypothetical protein
VKINTRVTRCVCEKVAQNVAQSIFCENYYKTFTVEKVSQLFGLLQSFSQNVPKENSHPRGENSPNMVTLINTQLSPKEKSSPIICSTSVIFT